jgi:uncharacterized OB-fold protein
MDSMTYRGLNLTIRPADRPYFEAASDGRLVFQRCAECGLVRYPTARLCGRCGADGYDWQGSAGHGVVVTSLLVVHGVRPQFPPPYAYGLVELDDLPLEKNWRVRMLVDFVEGDGDTPLKKAPPVGSPVTAVFASLGDGLALPRFAMAS